MEPAQRVCHVAGGLVDHAAHDRRPICQKLSTSLGDRPWLRRRSHLNRSVASASWAIYGRAPLGLTTASNSTRGGDPRCGRRQLYWNAAVYWRVSECTAT